MRPDAPLASVFQINSATRAPISARRGSISLSLVGGVRLTPMPFTLSLLDQLPRHHPGSQLSPPASSPHTHAERSVPMPTTTPASVAQLVAEAAIAYQLERTGHAPKSATAIITGDTLVITLDQALSEAERVLSQSPAGAAKVQEFHRELFRASAAPLRQAIELITGRTVIQADSELQPASGTVVHALANGTMVQVFLLQSAAPIIETSTAATPTFTRTTLPPQALAASGPTTRPPFRIT